MNIFYMWEGLSVGIFWVDGGGCKFVMGEWGERR